MTYAYRSWYHRLLAERIGSDDRLLSDTVDPRADRRSPAGWCRVRLRGRRHDATWWGRDLGGATGGGVIDGAGAGWWERFRAAQRAGKTPEDRPRLIAFNRCQHARIENLTLQNSPSFHLVLRSCTDVDVQHLSIKAPEDSPNTDGI